jgi:ADP-heptose:LPS heptosyltransferase/SAM-dependent methyltransferase
MRILVLSHHGLGDNVLLTTSLRKLHEKSRHTFIIATLKRFGNTAVELLSGIPYIEGVIPVLPDAWNDFNSYQEGIKEIGSYIQPLGEKLKCNTAIFPKCLVYPGVEFHKIFRFAREFDVKFESNYDFRPDLKVQKSAIEDMEKYLSQFNKKILVVHTKAGNEVKDLTKDQIAKCLTNFRDYDIIEVGTNLIEGSTYFPEDSMEKTKALIYLADHVLAIDSVVMHIAGAFLKPLTAIFTETQASQTLPLIGNAINIFAINNEKTQVELSQAQIRDIQDRYKNSILNNMEDYDSRFEGFYYRTRGTDFYKRWKFIEDKLERLGKTKNLKVLDIGCNNGYFTDKFSKISDRVLAIDIDEEQVNRTRNLGLENVETKLTDDLLSFLQNLDEKFDVVLYMGVHHHIYEQYSTDYADSVLNEISRVGDCMFFETGQVEERGNPYAIWKDLIPKMKDSKKEIPSLVLDNSNYRYCELIAFTTIHDADRFLFYFSGMPEPLKEIEFDGKKYKVKLYVYGKETDKPGSELVVLENPMEDYDPEIRKQTRYYLVEDENSKLFFVKEKLCSLTGDLLPKYSAFNEYERGQKLLKVEAIRNKIAPAIAINNNFLLYNYYNYPDLRILIDDPRGIKKEVADEIKKVARVIRYTLGEFDFNINNILVGPNEYKFIDFEYGSCDYKEKIDVFDLVTKQD